MKKMEKVRVSMFLVVMFFLAGFSLLHSQQVDIAADRLKLLKSANWEQREAAFEKLRQDQKIWRRPDVQVALVDLLDRENQVVHKTLEDSNGKTGITAEYGEGYGEYIGQLIDVVADIVDWHDPRQLCILAQSSYEPDTVFARELADKGGAAVVPCLLKMVQGGLYGRHYSADVRGFDRVEAIPVLAQILASVDLPRSLRERVQQSIVAGLQDSVDIVRLDTVEAVGKFGTLELIPILKNISRTDTESFPASDTPDGKEYFPIRAAATEAIQSIQERAAKTPNH